VRESVESEKSAMEKSVEEMKLSAFDFGESAFVKDNLSYWVRVLETLSKDPGSTDSALKSCDTLLRQRYKSLGFDEKLVKEDEHRIFLEAILTHIGRCNNVHGSNIRSFKENKAYGADFLKKLEGLDDEEMTRLLEYCNIIRVALKYRPKDRDYLHLLASRLSEGLPPELPKTPPKKPPKNPPKNRPKKKAKPPKNLPEGYATKRKITRHTVGGGSNAGTNIRLEIYAIESGVQPKPQTRNAKADPSQAEAPASEGKRARSEDEALSDEDGPSKRACVDAISEVEDDLGTSEVEDDLSFALDIAFMDIDEISMWSLEEYEWKRTLSGEILGVSTEEGQLGSGEEDG
jgi:hypothetical protein